MIGAVIISHRSLAEGVLAALFQITGAQKDMVAISSTGRSLAEVEEEIAGTIAGMRESDEILLLTDLHGGSSSIVCQRLLRRFPRARLIAGFNLPLLIQFILLRTKPLAEVVPILLTKGRDGIREVGAVEGG